jgi:hypothetical protein
VPHRLAVDGGFDGFPALENHRRAGGPSRGLELRTYESHNKAAHRKKTEMFNKGEIDHLSPHGPAAGRSSARTSSARGCRA